MGGVKNSWLERFCNHEGKIFDTMPENDRVKTGESRRLNVLGTLLAAAVSAILIGAVSVSFLRTHRKSFFSIGHYEATFSDATRWLDAVRSGSEGTALALAERIAPSAPPEIPDSDYLRLCDQLGISSALFSSPYNHLDFLRWRDALAAKREADSLCNDGGPPTPRKIFEILFGSHVISDSGSGVSPASLEQLFGKKRLSLNEMARLASAIARQSGHRAWVVVVFDKGRAPVRTLVEIRSVAGDIVSSDPLSGATWSGSVFDGGPLKDPPPGFKGRGPFSAFRYLPAETLDYKLSEQRLSRRLAELSGAESAVSIPLFGQDPRSQLDAFVETFPKDGKAPLVSYWHFPFESLKSSPEFPRPWTLSPKRFEREKH